MNLRDITDAIKADDKPVVRQAFRALVDYPNEERVEASSPGLIVVALNRVCAHLDSDDDVMPRGTCDVLDLPQGCTYAQGVAQAKRRQPALSRQIVERFAG